MRAWLLIVAALPLPVSAGAQSMPGMPGMSMPMPAKPKAKPAAKTTPRPGPTARQAAKPATHRSAPHAPMPQAPTPGQEADAPPSTTAPAAPAEDGAMPGMPMPAPPMTAAPEAGPMAMPGMTADDGHDGHSGQDGHDMAAMPGMAMPASDGAFASGSGTARLPGAEGMMHGVHLSGGGWTAMLHGFAWANLTGQSGPRGRGEAFVTSMAMAEAGRALGDGGARLTLRAMLSLDPLMGARGYPSLLATGETADGVTPLIDRQHPHDLFMELSGRIDVPLGGGVGGFVYGGPVAEPALGPSAFMHRGSATYLPLAPITHHWFDSTHITFGVATAGLSADHWQLEGSAFRGREPDQHRWDIEAPRFDSWSIRATWTPAPQWSAQLSHGRLHSPEALEPDQDEARTTATVQYAQAGVSALAGFAVKRRLPGRTLTAWIGEANWDLTARHSLFGRIENVANDELFPNAADPRHDRPFRVTRAELGYAYRVPIAGPLRAAIGASGFVIATPAALDSAYGRGPIGGTAFVKVSLGG